MRQTILRFFLFGLAAAVLPAFPALAETAPQPSADFEGNWDIEGGGPVKLHYSAALNIMRMEMSGPEGQAIMLKNFETGEAFNWSPDDPSLVMRMQGERGIDRTADPTGETKTIEGEKCAVWRAPEGDVCFTPDGIWLETRGPGNNSTVTSLKRMPQDQTLFKPPAGAQIMDMPQGMGPPGGTGSGPR